jgi:Ni/Fe-hydrogenase subunit HybB-like protein
VELVLGRGLTRACLLAVAAGTVAFVWGALGGHAPRTFAALIASWLFFSGAAMGTLAFGAVLALSGARWADGLSSRASAVISFVPVAMLLLVLIVAGVPSWAPWFDRPPPGQAFWLNLPFFAARELLSTAVLFGFAYLGMRRGDPVTATREPRSSQILVAFCLIFAVVLSFWAFDFVLGPDLAWSSTIIGPHVFVGAAASGASLMTLLGLAAGRLDQKMRRDMSALILTMSVLWGYFFWSQYLPIWYGNLPTEIAFIIRRTTGGWRTEAAIIVFLCFVVPFALLLGSRARASARILGTAAAAQFVGIWLERHLLVVPSLSPSGVAPFDLCGVLVALGTFGAFVLATGTSLPVPEVERLKRPYPLNTV